ncbi:MAG: hypothetical protein ABI081_08905 [Burkholderiaceae bacterium]
MPAVTLLIALTLLGSALLPPACLAAEGSVTIISPKDGATLNAKDKNKIVYDIVPGPRGDHVHVYVDDKEVDILRQLKGSYTFDSLSSGKHAICVKVVNKAHVPTGLQRCVNVTVE